MRRTIRAVAGLGVLMATLFVGGSLAGAPAGAQECGGYFGPPCEEDVLEFEYPACVGVDSPFTVSGSVTPADAASAGEGIDFYIDGLAAGGMDIEDDGTFSGTLNTPPALGLGDYTIEGVTGLLEASGPIEVCDDSGVDNSGQNNNGSNGTNGSNNASNGTGALSRTGFDSVPMITLGLAVLILGAAAVYGSKRRRLT